MQFGFLLKAGWIFSVLFFLGCGTLTHNAPLKAEATHVVTTNLSYTTRASADLGQFAGTWYAHGAVLTITSNGSATFEGRAYRWCGPGVLQPCDYGDAQGYIHDGNHEQIQLSHVSGSTAYGTVTTSSFHPAGMTVSISLQPHDTLLYSGNAPISLLCGPNAPVGTCGA